MVHSDKPTAQQFITQLQTYQSDRELEKIQRFFTTEDETTQKDVFLGVRMGQVFDLAKEFVGMSLPEIKKLLEHTIHEVRVGAVSIMDFEARNKKTPESRKKELFDLYIKGHAFINNLDLVDRSAPYVVGGYLFDKPRDILYKLARSKNMWERRTAIVSTYFFIRQGQLDDTFAIAEILVNDKQDLIHKAAGSWLRTAGEKDRKRLYAFLDKYAATMPRVFLRYSIEKLDKKTRDHYLNLHKL